MYIQPHLIYTHKLLHSYHHISHFRSTYPIELLISTNDLLNLTFDRSLPLKGYITRLRSITSKLIIGARFAGFYINIYNNAKD